MAQNKILTFLNRNKGKKFTVTQLSRRLGYETGNLSVAVIKLVRFHMIQTSVQEEKTYSCRDGKRFATSRKIRRIWVDNFK